MEQNKPTLAHLIGEHFSCQSSGTLTVKIGETVKDFIFENGQLIFAASSAEQFEDYLLKSEVLTPESLDLAKKVMQEAELPLDQILLEMNYVNTEKLNELMESYMVEIFLNSFLSRDLEYSFIDVTPSLKHRISRPTLELLKDSLNTLTEDEWKSLLEDDSLRLELYRKHTIKPEALGLDDDQQLLLKCFEEKPVSTAELLQNVFLPEDLVLRTVAELRVLGFVKPHSTQEERVAQAVRPKSTTAQLKQSASLFYLESQKLLKEQKVDEALNSICKALELSQSDPELWAQLARCYSHINGKHREAEEAYMEAMSRDATDASYPYELGQLYLKFNLRKRALEMFKEALKIDPEHAPAQNSIQTLLKEAAQKK